jgi:hypothetical protein
MTETTIKVQVLNGSAVILNNGEEQHVTTGETIYVPVPEGYSLVRRPELLDKGIPIR